jgi:hypothetical protein
MAFLNPKNLNTPLSKLPPLVLAICFSVITLFGTPLHDHDLDSSHLDLDCISCHLIQTNIGLENGDPDLSTSIQVLQWVSVAEADLFTLDLPSASSRAPPAFC